MPQNTRKHTYKNTHIKSDEFALEFVDEGMEREYWICILQNAIRKSLGTLKSNFNELPLAKMMEERDKIQAIGKDNNPTKPGFFLLFYFYFCCVFFFLCAFVILTKMKNVICVLFFLMCVCMCLCVFIFVNSKCDR